MVKPLARQFALMAAKLQMFDGKTRHVWHPIRTCCFVLRPHLDATHGMCTLRLNCCNGALPYSHLLDLH